jgi:hypothetical protein
MHSLPVSSFLNERAGRMWLRLLLVILESRSANRDTIVRQNKFCGQAVVRDRPEAPSRSIPEHGAFRLLETSQLIQSRLALTLLAGCGYPHYL